MSYLIAAHLAYQAGLCAPTTLRTRESVLRRLHAALPYGIAWATTDELRGWLAPFTRWTLVSYDHHIRAFYRWADGRHLEGDPAADLPRPRLPMLMPHPVTDDELHQALERSGPWWRLVIQLAALEGLRVSELARLDRSDVTEQLIRIRVAKGGNAATVPTHPQIWALVAGFGPGPLVVDRLGHGVTGDHLSRRARYHFDRIGLPDVHLHRFRHWFGTALLRAGVDLRVVQELLRHRSITSTQNYTLVESRDREDGIGRLAL